MWGVNFINVAYFFSRAYQVSVGAGGVNFSFIPPWAFFTVEVVYIVGMALTLLLLIMVVYTQIRLVVVEHEGFHALEEQDHALVKRVEHETEAAFVEEAQRSDRWENIVILSESTSPGDWRRAILEADIMLFDVLGMQGYPGETVGERLKHANPIQMTTLNEAWKAHKLRNDIAHSGESLQLSEREVRVAINQYRSVFEEFGLV